MKKLTIICFALFAITACSGRKDNNLNSEISSFKMGSMTKSLDTTLPTVGILISEGFLTNEVVAPMDVFAAADANGNKKFNVVLIAKENKVYESEQGLKVIPDFTIDQTPKLKALVVGSSYHMHQVVEDKEIVNFVREQNKTTDYIASHCAGAFLLGESGVADNREIVTFVTGGESLKKEYPNLKVMDDSKVSVARDGKIFSSNGSLVSYLGSLDLLEEMTSLSHRKDVENHLQLNRLRGKE